MMTIIINKKMKAMTASAFELFAAARGLVVAPAGCGKTETIVTALSTYEGRPVLVLTHTNAGVAALRTRLARADIPASRFRLGTIDGWAMKLVRLFPQRAGMRLDPLSPVNYPAVQRACAALLTSGAMDGLLPANYGRVVVDEYQDCSHEQHAIIMALAARLPTAALGDPLQRIFDFRAGSLPDWHTEVVRDFPIVAEFDKPWRWVNAGQETFGRWVLTARVELLAGRPLDLRGAPVNVTWASLPADPQARQRAHTTVIGRIPAGADNRLLVIGDSRNRNARNRFAQTTPGVAVVEPVDLTDLVNGAEKIMAVRGVPRLAAALQFAKSVMTGIDIEGTGKRLTSLSKGSAKNPATAAEGACLKFPDHDGYPEVRAVLAALAAESGRRVYRRQLLNAMLEALQRAAARADGNLVEAAVSTREQQRMAGRALPGRALGSTLLLKGLEAEHAVILDADVMNARHLYVALNRSGGVGRRRPSKRPWPAAPGAPRAGEGYGPSPRAREMRSP